MEFYDPLARSRNNPDELLKDILSGQLDDLFTTETGYDDPDNKSVSLVRRKGSSYRFKIFKRSLFTMIPQR